MHTRKQQKTAFASPYMVLPLVGLAVILVSSAGCRSAAPPAPATIIDNNPGTDPSDANLAPIYSPPSSSSPHSSGEKVRALGEQQSYSPQQTSEQYGQQAPPSGTQYPTQANDTNQQYNNGSPNGYDSGEAAGYEALADASQPPPPLPQYDQPPVPEPNDLWTPGYWNYAPQGYFWVPGAWVAPPYAGALWTPAYWGYDGGHYRLHRGFWARHIGFYGGINYGFGYTGTGYRGGYWNGNNFYYNRAVNHVNITNIHNVYERNITVNNVTRISYNGGNGGIQARPGPQELAVLHEQRTQPMATQVQLREASAQNRQQFFSENHGRPAEPFAVHPVAAERGIQPPSTQPLQQRPEQLNPAVNQQRLSQEQQHQAAPTLSNGRTPPSQQPHEVQQSQAQPRFDTHPASEPLPNKPQPNAQPQQNAAQQQRLQQQQQAEQQQRTSQQQAQQQHVQQQAQQQVQQQHAIQQQQTEQQKNLQQRTLQPQPRPEAQPRPQQPQAHPQPQPQQPQAHTQPPPQQARPQPQAPHQQAPRAEPSHPSHPNK